MLLGAVTLIGICMMFEFFAINFVAMNVTFLFLVLYWFIFFNCMIGVMNIYNSDLPDITGQKGSDFNFFF